MPNVKNHNRYDEGDFIYYRVTRKDSDLKIKQAAIDKAIAYAESKRPKLDLSKGWDADEYNIWTNIKNLLELMKEVY